MQSVEILGQEGEFELVCNCKKSHLQSCFSGLGVSLLLHPLINVFLSFVRLIESVNVFFLFHFNSFNNFSFY